MTAKALTESRFKVSLTSQKTFEPWSGSVGEEVALDDDKKAGWNAYEMQRVNEKKMGYVSKFNELEFTTPLDTSSPGYKERALQAEALARSMDREKSSKRSDSGHERSEEQKYGSVSRKVDKNKQVTKVPPGESATPPIDQTRRVPVELATRDNLVMFKENSETTASDGVAGAASALPVGDTLVL